MFDSIFLVTMKDFMILIQYDLFKKILSKQNMFFNYSKINIFFLNRHNIKDHNFGTYGINIYGNKIKRDLAPT